ncbi:MAG: hypothetical protein KAH38_06105 [Candidatus Hydrogenedentes bacterium]|nr:hypothetical protein [Candidatus Hydrogenedentota bacterium]
MSSGNTNRRGFLKASTFAMGYALVAGAEEKKIDAPKVIPEASETKYWMHGINGDTPQDTAQELHDAGFNVVVAGGDTVIEAVKNAGMESWLCGGGFPLVRDDDAIKAIDIMGAPQKWFGSGSPNSPEVREASVKSYEEMVKTEGITGILVDGCRFASPASGLMPFLTDFSAHSSAKADALGFDFSLMKRDVARLHKTLTGAEDAEKRSIEWLSKPVGIAEWLVEHPGVVEWLRFRRVCSTEHFMTLAEIIHGAGLRMGVYIFSPCIAPLVGQSYEDLRSFVDVFAPMIYRNYPKDPGPACLNWELTELPQELGVAGTPSEQPVMDMIMEWTGFSDLPVEHSVEAVRKALPPGAVGLETQRARDLIGGKELAPIIYIDDPEMAVTAQQVRDAGADGVNFFVFKEKWADMVRPAFV